jgi:hypothetical protein
VALSSTVLLPKVCHVTLRFCAFAPKTEAANAAVRKTLFIDISFGLVDANLQKKSDIRATTAGNIRCLRKIHRMTHI